ncbi:uncharacterized protein LODBEIA_P05470 [Lodderomyces beijingensis]|uniref:Ribosomal RNA-processing protein 43 n=1 Tax=Lodderomyces beijingensis TaxID=1775926 RepID=A0ABP0ZDT0_9ASCO
MTELKQVTFTPEVLERIAPDVSLQRHLAIGIRPNLRYFHEFKSIEFGNSSQIQQSSANVIASSILKSGSTTVINSITLSIVEDLYGGAKLQDYATIYPQVEILRGRSGAPTDEEMILSQDLFESFRRCRVIPSSNLRITNVGIAVKDDESGAEEIIYPDLDETQWQLANLSNMHDKAFSFVLHSHIKIYSKQVSTNSLFDLCFASCLKALRELKLPRCYVDDTISTKISIRSRKSNARGTVDSNRGTLMLDCRDEMRYKLELNASANTVSSNFGVIKKETAKDQDIEMEDGEGAAAAVVMLTDLEGEAEESSVLSRISIINSAETINKISLVSDGVIDLETLKQAIDASQKRAEFSESL